jgi:hypothetical protein
MVSYIPIINLLGEQIAINVVAPVLENIASAVPALGHVMRKGDNAVA